MNTVFAVQYQSVDKNWYDSGLATDRESAIRLYHSYIVNSPRFVYRVVERTDKVIWPLDGTIDPASQGGA